MSIPQILTYIAYLFIIVAYAVKVVKIARMPRHLRWELYPIPHEKGFRHGGSYLEEPDWWTKPRHKNQARDILFKLRDYFTFPGYFRHSKVYWLGLYPWHIGFYAIVTFHILSFISAVVMVTTGVAIANTSPNFGAQFLYYLTIIIAAASFILGSIGSVVLLAKRLIDRDLRSYAAPSNYFNYLFFLVVFLSGLVAWLFSDIALSGYREFWKSLITFRYIAVEPATYTHIILFSLFLIYLPFTRSTHYITKVFAFFGILWDDTPNLPGTKNGFEKQLSQPVSWSASHIQSGKTWGEVVKAMPEDTTGTTHK